MRRAIRSTVAPAALASIAQMFDRGADAIVAELFDNARRAGATAIEVWTAPAGIGVAEGSHTDGWQLTVTDDGCGIADPQVLLTMGVSGWETEAVRHEEPAGLGLYSTATTGCRIESRTGEGHSFAVTLEPRHFRGEADPELEPAEDPPSPHGTRVSTLLVGPVDDIVTRAARYLPVDVTLNGTPVKRDDFLHGAVRIEECDGVRIGVFRGAQSGGSINLHGRLIFRGAQSGGNMSLQGRLVREPGLPRLPALAGPGNHQQTWTARIDAADAQALRIDVRTGGLATTKRLERLRRTALAAIYRAIGESADTRVEYERCAEAAQLGIALDSPPAALPPWRPTPADPELAEREQENETLEELSDSAVVMSREPANAADQVAFARAARLAEESGAWKARIYRSVAEYDGYKWYDRLPRITGIKAVVVSRGGETLEADLTDRQRPRLPPGRPERMELRVEVTSADGHRHETVIGLDLLFGTPSAREDNPLATGMQVRAGARIDAREIGACFRYACFEPDTERLCWNGLDREEFLAEATSNALRVLESDAQADEHAIRHRVQKHVVPRVPAGAVATVKIDRRNRKCPKISLRIHKPGSQADAAGRATGSGNTGAQPAQTPGTSSSGSPPTAPAT